MGGERAVRSIKRDLGESRKGGEKNRLEVMGRRMERGQLYGGRGVKYERLGRDWGEMGRD